VRNADAGLEPRGVGPQGCEAAAGPLGKRVVGHIERAAGSTPFRPCGTRGSLDTFKKTSRFSPRRAGERSVSAARNVWANDSIRQKIIGHRMAVGRYQPGRGLIGRSLGVGCAHITFAQLEEHASDHGVGIFVDPLVEEGIDFLAEIRGVTEAGEFVALERVARSSEKELPGWLGAISGHKCLRGREGISNLNLLHRITKIRVINSTVIVLLLWKTVESVEKDARACSGCAGDYEDPERSAWEEDFEEEDVDFQEEAGDEPGTAE